MAYTECVYFLFIFSDLRVKWTRQHFDAGTFWCSFAFLWGLLVRIPSHQTAQTLLWPRANSSPQRCPGPTVIQTIAQEQHAMTDSRKLRSIQRGLLFRRLWLQASGFSPRHAYAAEGSRVRWWLGGCVMLSSARSETSSPGRPSLLEMTFPHSEAVLWIRFQGKHILSLGTFALDKSQISFKTVHGSPCGSKNTGHKLLSTGWKSCVNQVAWTYPSTFMLFFFRLNFNCN